MKYKARTKKIFWLIVVMAISLFIYNGLREYFRDKSVIPQSSWTDSENLVPLLNVKWAFPGLGEMLNVYGMTWLNLEEGDFDILKVEGIFPNCRYFSFSLHTHDMQAETFNLKDYQIIPDKGYVNPFVPGNKRLENQKYTLYIVKEGVKIDPSLKNVLYAPKHFTNATLATRQYRADDDTPLKRAAQPYPVITALHDDMTPGIAPSASGLPDGAANYLDFDKFEAAYDKHMAFQINNGNPDSIDFLPYGGDQLGPSKDNRYLMATLGGDFSKVAIVGMPKPPTYENTRYGGSFVGGKNVRYWSFCHAEGRMGMVNDCINDDRMKVNSDGSVTLVIGPRSIKDSVEKAGLTFLPWTRNRTIYKPFLSILLAENETYDPTKLEKKTLLAFRQVMADPSWDGAIISHAERYFDLFSAVEDPFEARMGERAEVVLGDAGPRGFVLDMDTFMSGLERGDFSKAFTSKYNSSSSNVP